MTVGELINELKELAPETPIIISNSRAMEHALRSNRELYEDEYSVEFSVSLEFSDYVVLEEHY